MSVCNNLTAKASIPYTTKKLLILLAVLVVVIGVYLFYSLNYNRQNTAVQTETYTGNYTVSFKANVTNNGLTDVYLKEINSGTEKFYRALPNVYREHYHAAEFVDGSLYIIERTGVEANSNLAPDWTDQLWKYGTIGQGQIIYVGRGLDFRVSSDDQRIAVFQGSDTNPFDQNVIFTDSTGKIIKKFENSDFLGKTADNILTPLFWEDGTFWMSANQEMSVINIYSVTANDTITPYNVSDLQFDNSEFTIRTNTKKIIFDTFKPPLAVDSSGVVPNQNVIVYLYDFTTHDKTKLVSFSTNRSLSPNWINDSTAEYLNAQGNKVIVDINSQAKNN